MKRFSILLCSCLLLFACKNRSAQLDELKYPNFKAYDDTASVYYIHKQYKQGTHYLDSVFKRLDNPGIIDKWNYYRILSKAILTEAKETKSIYQLQQALKIADAMINMLEEHDLDKTFKKEMANTIFFKGEILFEMKRFGLAYQNFYQAKLIADQLSYDCDKASFIVRLAFINYQQKRYRDAARLFYQSYQKRMACVNDFDTFVETQQSASNAGLSYEKVKMTDSAFICYQKGLAYIAKNEHKFKNKTYIRLAKGVFYKNMAVVYVDSGNFAKAEKLFQKSILYIQAENTEPVNRVEAYLGLAKLYFDQGEFAKTKQILDANEKEVSILNDNSTTLLWLEMSVNYFNITQQYQKARLLQQRFLVLQAKIMQEERNLNQFSNGNQLVSLQRDYELSLLKKESQFNSIFLILTSAIVVLAGAIIYQILRSWRTTKRNNENLKRLNTQITEQNLNLQIALNALEKSHDENNRVMRVIAHDLRSPIGAIVNLAALIVDDEKLSEDAHQMVSLIKSSATDSLRFVNNLLNQNGEKNVLDKELVDLDALLKYCINLLQYKALEKKQHVILNSQPILINVNREKIWRVVSNLFTNAVKFSQEGGTIEVTLNLQEQDVIISVRDEGMGIPDHLKNTIFSLQDEVRRPGTGGEKSHGIGLNISKQIIEAHGGKIWFESQENKGSIFFFKLPLDKKELAGSLAFQNHV
ncbi:tetratricopeptide repeat-containing sensor histidine kinase [Pedobacter sandarakinus]|uniref:tetratricopeptide repeat-containing sensor histidine kinase n=1 Tax=Pedobacter sandarakinus TaxID=353156 RepID=UPI00224719D5|nr:tetratricopeptide repeat-containing sensor histidine kinase [Pedobacter sandarakinus]MCX2575198.1 tetratricopeptide repeat-containing sensor histidine kinase [Pedobacter sandarakinus]